MINNLLILVHEDHEIFKDVSDCMVIFINCIAFTVNVQKSGFEQVFLRNMNGLSMNIFTN